MLRPLCALACLVLVLLTATACQKSPDVVLKTTHGDIGLVLYKETGKHRENFLKLARKGYYDNQLFHRVIQEFVIQAGDSNSKDLNFKGILGVERAGYFIDAEILPQYFHRRGALGAAREPDQINPTRRSSGSQFYIVQGKKQTAQELDDIEKYVNDQRMGAAWEKYLMAYMERPEHKPLKDSIMAYQEARYSGDTLKARQYEPGLKKSQQLLDTLFTREYRAKNAPFRFTEDQRRIYMEQGGTPSLDGDYTIFGEVVSGMEVVDSIAAVKVDAGKLPLQPVRILKVEVLTKD